jgi:putative colanic acid biosynthesis acetyltransferase WcaF
MIKYLKRVGRFLGFRRDILESILDYSFNNFITHIPIRLIRISYLRLFNRNIHHSAVILMHTRILSFWKIHIAEGVVINQYCLLDCRVNCIYIGLHSDIGPYTHIWTMGHSPDSDTHAAYGGDVVIGHHVWIASRATILPKINLANGTVVAAGSIVVKSTQENDIIAGNPAKVTRKRNNDLTYSLNFDPFLQ